MIATTFLELVFVLAWPIALSAAAWVVAINALTKTDEISEVVKALTLPNDVEQNANRGRVSFSRSNVSAFAGGIESKLRDQIKRSRHSTSDISKAKVRAMKRTLLRGDDRRGDRARSARRLQDHELSEVASP